jgi:hypothetical protein
MKYTHDQALTVGILSEILVETLDPRFKEIDRKFEIFEEKIEGINRNVDIKISALESKMMEGFEALEGKIDFVEAHGEARDAELLKEIKNMGSNFEQRSKLINAQIEYLATNKADRKEEDYQEASKRFFKTSGSLV